MKGANKGLNIHTGKSFSFAFMHESSNKMFPLVCSSVTSKQYHLLFTAKAKT